MASRGFTPQINFEGFVNFFIGSDGRCRSYTQVFRNGIIEAVAKLAKLAMKTWPIDL